MSKLGPSGKPNSRRYTPEEKAQAVRLVHALRAELGTSHGTVGRIAEQLGYGRETVRKWVREDEIGKGEAATPAETATAVGQCPVAGRLTTLPRTELYAA